MLGRYSSDRRGTPLYGNSHDIEVLETSTHLIEKSGRVVSECIGNKTLFTHPTDGNVRFQRAIRHRDDPSARNIYMLPLTLLAVSAEVGRKRRLRTLN